MSTQTLARSKYESAYRRWAGVGPYYAMFPIAFAERVIRQYTGMGDVVLDPFLAVGPRFLRLQPLIVLELGLKSTP